MTSDIPVPNLIETFRSENYLYSEVPINEKDELT